MRLLPVAATAWALVLGTVALAQPRGARPTHPAPPPSTGSAAVTPSAVLDAAALSPPAPPADLGGGAKLSPLNPAANEFSDAGMTSASIDYDRLLTDLASLRARAAAVSDVLFHSRLAIAIETSGDHGRIASLSVALDDGVIWASPTSFRAEDATTVYDHAVAPGHHAVTIDIERHDDRDDTFRSSQKSRFIVDVPSDGRLWLDVKLSDESSMGGDFRSDKRGQYDLRVRAQAKAQTLTQGR
jgi:hypothetical protein